MTLIFLSSGHACIIFKSSFVYLFSFDSLLIYHSFPLWLCSFYSFHFKTTSPSSSVVSIHSCIVFPHFPHLQRHNLSGYPMLSYWMTLLLDTILWSHECLNSIFHFLFLLPMFVPVLLIQSCVIIGFTEHVKSCLIQLRFICFQLLQFIFKVPGGEWASHASCPW